MKRTIAPTVLLCLLVVPQVRPADAPELLTLEAARDAVASLVPEVERLRGLAFKSQVPVKVVDDARLRKYVMKRLDRFDQRAHLAALQVVYEALGLVPEGTNLVDAIIDVLEEQAGGFYDPESGSYYLLDDTPSAAVSLFSVHELTHALEDQHFDLDGRLREALDDDDRLLAISAVHEGSAMVLMSVYAMQATMRGDLDPSALTALAQTEAGRAAKLSAMPTVLQRQLLAPYILGMSFMSRGNLMRMAEGFPSEEADRVMREGPTSSEQILHPEKFWDPERRDDPQAVSIEGAGAVLGERWKLKGQGVLGEITLGPIVGAPTPELAGLAMTDASGWTNAEAAGWGGDRWQLWVHGKQSVVLVLTAWDTEADAKDFAEALPGDGSLRHRVAGTRVAIVAGDAGKLGTSLLARMLGAPPTKD